LEQRLWARFRWNRRKQVPGVEDAFQLRHAAIRELDVRAIDEVGNGSRYEHLVGAGERADPRSNIDRDASDVVVDHFALASVKAGPYRNAQCVRARADRTGACDRAS
jgi:hypothetical protein